MCTTCSSGDIQTKFYLLPRFLNHVSSYSFKGLCDPFLQVLNIPYLLSIHNVLNVPSQEKIKWREIWALRWPGYWSNPSNPGIRNLSFKTSVTKQLKWGGAPSCIKITILTVSCSKVSICGNMYCLSYSGFKSRPSFLMTLYLKYV